MDALDATAVLLVVAGAGSEEALRHFEDAVVLIEGQTESPDDSVWPGPLESDGYLLAHPSFDGCQQMTAKRPLDADEALVIYEALQAATLGEIAEILSRPFGEVASVALRLIDDGICAPAPAPVVRFHTFLATGQVVLPRDKRTLKFIVENLFPTFGEAPFGVSSATDETFTYADATEIIDAIAAALVANGVGKGDRIFLQSAPRIEGVFLFWACARIGAVFAPVDRNWPQSVLVGALEDCTPSVIFMDSERAQSLNPSWQDKLVAFDHLDDEPELPHGARVLSDWIGDGTDNGVVDVSPEDVAILQYTSGSTGVPKCIAITNYAYMASGIVVTGIWGITSDDTLLTAGELHTGGGLRHQVLVPALVGATSVMPGEKDVSNVLTVNECCRRHGVSILTTTPAYLRRLLELKDRLDELIPSSVRMVIGVGSPLLSDVVEDLTPLVRARITDYFGLTECGPHLLPSLRRNGSVAASGGIPAYAVVQIVDSEGKLVKESEIGELRFHSARLMFGYVGNTKGLTKDVLRGPWFYTGDLASWDDEGRVKIVGRKREIVKDAQGQVIYMTEVEAVLFSDSSVRDAAASGYTTRKGDEYFAAFVELDSDESDKEAVLARLKSLMHERLGAQRSPRHIFVVPTMPRGAGDKIKKIELIEKHITE